MARTFVNVANAVWNIWNNTGIDTNGGGFVLGSGTTDTQFTDLAVDSANSKLVSSASYNFVAGDVGKYIFISSNTGGWCAGWYNIVSVALNNATLDMSPAPVSTTGGTYQRYKDAIDSSRQASPQVNINNSTVTATTAAANSNVMTLTGYTVQTSDVGNIVQIASGTNMTAGFYFISSVNTGANSWTLAGSTNATGAGGAGSAIVAKMGGAVKTLNAGSNSSYGSQSNKFMVKGEASQSVATTVQFATNDTSTTGSATVPSTWLLAYTNSFDDGGTATFKATSAAIVVFLVSSTDIQVMGLIADGNSQTGVTGYSTNNSRQNYANVKALNCFKSGFHMNGNLSQLEYFESTGGSNTAVISNAAVSSAVTMNAPGWTRCGYIHDNVQSGFGLGSGGSTTVALVENCLIVKSTGAGGALLIDYGGYDYFIVQNTFDQADLTALFLLGAAASTFTNQSMFNIKGNIISRWGMTAGTFFGIDFGTAGFPALWCRDGNAYWNANNSGANRNDMDDQGTTTLITGYVPWARLNARGTAATMPYGTFDVTLTANPFTSSTDWSLNSTPGGGAACKGTAPLNSYFGTTMASHRSFGALQEASGGSAGSVPNVGLRMGGRL